MFIYIGFGAATDEWLSAGTVTQWSWVWVRDEKEPKTSKNKANQNPGFAKNQTEPKPESENVQEPEQNHTQWRTEQNLKPNVRDLIWFIHWMKLYVHSHVLQ